MEWYIRFINGLPPRKDSDDQQQFHRTFPEVNYQKFSFLHLHPLFFNSSKEKFEDLLDQWINQESDQIKNQPCPFKFCANNPNQSKDGIYLELVRLPPLKEETEENKISSFLQDLKKLTGEIQANKILYFDSYIAKSLYETNNMTNSILNKIKSGYNLKEIELRGPDGWYVKPNWNAKTTKEINSKLQSNLNAIFVTANDNIHDRFIIFFNKDGNPLSGVSIGTSINSLFNKKSYFMLKLDNEDIKKILEQI